MSVKFNADDGGGKKINPMQYSAHMTQYLLLQFNAMNFIKFHFAV